ncbi:hypothetical protein MP228_006884 [Amoeboaphelidium protococcarum]|nr:hypothetical protein MP228_006884 [Amoeboaphelidium protococcarum]
MDMQNRVGVKFGGGGVATASDQNLSRRERQRQLALETVDLSKDPYILKNHLGTFECKLCLTLHVNEGSYLAHTQGKKHKANLARRAAKEAKQLGPGAQSLDTLVAAAGGSGKGDESAADKKAKIQRTVARVGRPGYKIQKIRDPLSGRYGLLFQIHVPLILADVHPMYRFMSAYEQKVDTPDNAWQYLVIAADPYENIAFKIPNTPVDINSDLLFDHYDVDTHVYTVQIMFALPKA